MKKRIYISGAISGNTGETREEKLLKFELVSEYFRRRGYDVVNPLDVPPCDPEVKEHTWECFMRHDIKELMTCNAIAMIDGWHKSKGAVIEHDLAMILGFDVRYVDERHMSNLKTQNQFRDTMRRLANLFSNPPTRKDFIKS